MCLCVLCLSVYMCIQVQVSAGVRGVVLSEEGVTGRVVSYLLW